MCVWNLLSVKIGQAFCFSLIASDQDHSVILTINSCSHFLLSAWVRGRVLLPPANPVSHQPTLQTGLLPPQTWPAAAALHPTASICYNASSTRPGHTGWTTINTDSKRCPHPRCSRIAAQSTRFGHFSWSTITPHSTRFSCLNCSKIMTVQNSVTSSGA